MSNNVIGKLNWQACETCRNDGHDCTLAVRQGDYVICLHYRVKDDGSEHADHERQCRIEKELQEERNTI